MIQKSFPSTPTEKSPEMPILEHGLDMIFRNGVRSFTVELLAKDLAMSKKTIYKFFPTKDVLIQKIFQYVMGHITNKFESIHKLDMNPLEKFESATDEIAKTLNRVSLGRLSELKARHPQIWREIEGFRLDRRSDFLTIFQEAKDLGYVREDIDLDITATIFMNIINNVFQPEFLVQNNLGLKDTLLTLRSIFLRGIMTERGHKYLKDRI